jgi:hypothetical protein
VEPGDDDVDVDDDMLTFSIAIGGRDLVQPARQALDS